MKKIAAVLLACMALSGCEELDRQTRIRDTARSEISANGFAKVGKTPDGSDILMTITPGFEDRVYFISDTVTAIENCGKGCVRSITTTRVK